MRISKRTGRDIWEDLNRTKGELSQLDKALGELKSGSLPYNILEKAYEEKQAQVNELMNAEYTVS